MRPAIALSALLIVVAAAEADAQRRSSHRMLRPARGFIGGGLNVGQPLGVFGDSVGAAIGGAGHLIYALDRAGLIALRAEGGVLIYDNERRTIPWGGAVGGRILLDLNTSNDVIWFGGGLQAMAPGRTVRPYAAATIGLSSFQTNSRLSGSDDQHDFGRTTNFRDAWKVYYSGTGGIYIPLRGGPRPVMLDLGANYMRNGSRSWLKKGSIMDNPDNTLTFTPIRSDANIMSYRIGITAGAF